MNTSDQKETFIIPEFLIVYIIFLLDIDHDDLE